MSTTVGRSTSGGGASGSPAARKGCDCSRPPTTKSRISQFDGRACGSRRDGVHRHAVHRSGIGAHPALELGQVGGVALLHLLGAGDEEDGRDLLLGAGDRLEPGAEGGRVALQPVDEVRRHRAGLEGGPDGVPVVDLGASARSASVASRVPATRTVARCSGSASSVSRSASTSYPAAVSATTANSIALPQLMICWRPVGSSTGSARSVSRYTSSRSGVATKRQGCVLWIDGARVAAATTCAQSCSSTRTSRP